MLTSSCNHCSFDRNEAERKGALIAAIMPLALIVSASLEVLSGHNLRVAFRIDWRSLLPPITTRFLLTKTNL